MQKKHLMNDKQSFIKSVTPTKIIQFWVSFSLSFSRHFLQQGLCKRCTLLQQMVYFNSFKKYNLIMSRPWYKLFATSLVRCHRHKLSPQCHRGAAYSLMGFNRTSHAIRSPPKQNKNVNLFADKCSIFPPLSLS